MNLMVTFPEEKKAEVIKSLQDIVKQSEKWSKSKVTKRILSLSSKFLPGLQESIFSHSEYTLVDNNKIYWKLSVLMEGIINQEEIAARLNNQFKKKLGEGASVKLWKMD